LETKQGCTKQKKQCHLFSERSKRLTPQKSKIFIFREAAFHSKILIEMFMSFIYILVGLVLLAVGAEGLVRGSSSVALRLGVTPLVVGLTIVAFGTGSPELVVSISSALTNNSGLALGNVVGSNISNIALILGIAALIRPLNVRAEIVRRETPVMVTVTALFWLLLYDGELGRIDGAILAFGAVAYTFLTYYLSKQKRQKEVDAEFEEASERSKGSVWRDALFIVAGLALLIAGAHLLIAGAVTIAQHFGLSEVVIGLTIIAVGTSLPELATSALAARKNEPDVALGNAIGSNVLNILAVLGITALIAPISTEGIRTLDLAVMLGSAVLLNVFLGRKFVLDRIEGAILLMGYVIYIYSILP
jgi:cation:H+ antiporter